MESAELGIEHYVTYLHGKDTCYCMYMRQCGYGMTMTMRRFLAVAIEGQRQCGRLTLLAEQRAFTKNRPE